MNIVRADLKKRVAAGLNALREGRGMPCGKIQDEDIVAERPPDARFGDVGFPLFPFAKIFRTSAKSLAEDLKKFLDADEAASRVADFSLEGPYLNAKLRRMPLTESTIAEVKNHGSAFGRNSRLAGERIMVEFSSPNTNKPLHLGHLRNNALGESISRILRANGAEVRKINLINDRGIHICKSMVAYSHFGEGRNPEEAGQKGDHFVGSWYVRFDKEYRMQVEELRAAGIDENEAQANAPFMQEARKLLILWESGDEDTIALWRKMNGWTMSGMEATYARTGISFDAYYRESETYLTGKDEVLKGLGKGIFRKDEDGFVWCDCAEIGLDKKALLRSDGTSIYITQDIGTAIHRHEDWPFTRLVYVVASEQQYHFKVLFFILQKLGYSWAKSLRHLSYGLVNLPEGRMKSREGTIVDADDLLDDLSNMAKEEIGSKGREEAVGDPESVAEKIALGALQYYLLQASPAKDMLFDPKESLSFAGNTGPYIQYMGARISSMIRKWDAENDPAQTTGGIDSGLLKEEVEWELIKLVSSYPETVEEAAKSLDPSVLAAFLYELSAAFSRFYHDFPIVTNPDRKIAAARLELSRVVLAALKSGMELSLIPFLEAM